MGCCRCYHHGESSFKPRVISEEEQRENQKWLMEDKQAFLKYLDKAYPDYTETSRASN